MARSGIVKVRRLALGAALLAASAFPTAGTAEAQGPGASNLDQPGSAAAQVVLARDLKGLVPLDPGTQQTILVVGSRGGGATLAAELRRLLPPGATVTTATARVEDTRRLAELGDKAAAADVVVLVHPSTGVPTTPLLAQFRSLLRRQSRTILVAPRTSAAIRGLAAAGTLLLPAEQWSPEAERAAARAIAGRAPVTGRLTVALDSLLPAGAGVQLNALPSPRPAMHTDALGATIQQLLERAVTDSAFPGAFAIVGRSDRILATASAGRMDWKPSPSPDAQTLWDLASLTKVVGMTSAMMQLVERGAVDLDAPVRRYLTEWGGPYTEQVTVRHLLTHSSGLPAWRPLYKEATSPDHALAVVYATPLDTVPGARMVYSDLGAILAGQIVERVSGMPLDEYLTKHVFGPLGMRSTLYRPDTSLRERIAPTEFDPWRQRHLRGEVHDENAYALGGISGHAGLFGTGEDLARFARMYLNGGTLDGARIFAPGTIARFTRVQEPAFSNRAIGWEVPTGSNSAGHRLSAAAFGHTGFTGTSLWIDPASDVFIILLTNRVNPTRENRRITDVRVALADAVMGLLLSPASTSTLGRP